jgi:hypothetical protein
MVSINITEKITTTRTVEIDPNDNDFYAWIMFDNHTFCKTKVGTRVEVYEEVKQIKEEDPPMFALYSFHSKKLDNETKLIPCSRNIEEILDPTTWGKPFNPFD